MPKGSGFFIHKEGFIITALHVVEGETILQISQERNRFYPAEVVYKEPRFDLALLKTGLTKEIVSLRLNRMDELQLNDSIYLIGSPLGLNQSLLKGFISVLERTHFDPKYPDIPYIQTYGTSFEGCSGAAVYTYNGKLLGVNRATYGTAFGNSFGLVLPSEFLEIFLNESQKNGVFPGLKYSLFP